jgi:hypothetical protein
VAAVVKRIERSSSSTPLESVPVSEPAADGSSDLAEPQPDSEEFDAAVPVAEDLELDADADGLEDGDPELTDEPELAGVGAGAGGRLRGRFGIG